MNVSDGNSGDTELAPPLQLADTIREIHTREVAPPPPKIIAILPRGTTVRRYVILDCVGAGAMGVVYAAYDYDLDRRVALKLVRDPRRGLIARERLIREAKALAKLSHPHVITVYDVGLHEDEVFVAMEFVDGRTLRSWFEEKPRPWREVLDVFLRAGEGLAAAHAAGLVHRDFKPDNVFVANDGRVLVGDFGLAQGPAELDSRASRPLGVSILTPAGATIGTPAYMAPEQVVGGTLDARADQFSFCVALYEALYGVRPFAGETLEEIFDHIEHGQVVESSRAREVPGRIRRAVVRGLAMRPSERHPSMEAILQELRREPRRKRRRWVAAAAAGAGALVLGLALTFMLGGGAKERPCPDPRARLVGIWDGGRSQAIAAAFRRSGSPLAEEAWKKVQGALDRYATGWVAMYGEACRATRVRGEASEDLLDLRMQCLDRRRSELGALTEALANADEGTVTRAGDAVSRLTPLELCGDAQALRDEPPPPEPRQRAAVEDLRERHGKVRALLDTGQYKVGIDAARELVTEARRVGYRPLEAEALLTLAMFERHLPKGSTEHLLYDAIAAAEAGRASHVAMRAWLELVFHVGEIEARYDEAHRLAIIARGVIARGGGSPRFEATLEDYVGLLYLDQGRLADARPHLERGLALYTQATGPESRNTASALQHLGLLADAEGRHEEALTLHRRAREATERRLGFDHPDTLSVLGGEAVDLIQTGRLDEALGLLERGFEASQRLQGPTSANAAMFLTGIGMVHERKGEREEARHVYQRSLEMVAVVYGIDHPAYADGLLHLGDVLRDGGHHADAILQYQRAAAILEKLGPNHPSLADVLCGLGRAHVLSGDLRQAVAVLERAVEIRRAAALPELQTALARLELARALAQIPLERQRAKKIAAEVRAVFEREGDATSARAAAALE